MISGFLYVATKNPVYYDLAVYSMESLRDYYPHANICFFTHPEWVTKRGRRVADHIITEDVPSHKRAKLWALDQTPFDLTCYIDADTEIEHTDIQYIFDQIDPESDLAFTRIRDYGVAIKSLHDGVLELHCGLFLYRSNQNTFDLLRAWWERYNYFKKDWIPGENYPRHPLEGFDTFTLWWLLHKEGFEDTVTINYMEDDARWNLLWSYYDSEAQNPIVIRHTRVPDD